MSARRSRSHGVPAKLPGPQPCGVYAPVNAFGGSALCANEATVEDPAQGYRKVCAEHVLPRASGVPQAEEEIRERVAALWMWAKNLQDAISSLAPLWPDLARMIDRPNGRKSRPRGRAAAATARR